MPCVKIPISHFHTEISGCDPPSAWDPLTLGSLLRLGPPSCWDPLTLGSPSRWDPPLMLGPPHIGIPPHVGTPLHVGTPSHWDPPHVWYPLHVGIPLTLIPPHPSGAAATQLIAVCPVLIVWASAPWAQTPRWAHYRPIQPISLPPSLRAPAAGRTAHACTRVRSFVYKSATQTYRSTSGICCRHTKQCTTEQQTEKGLLCRMNALSIEGERVILKILVALFWKSYKDIYTV